MESSNLGLFSKRFLKKIYLSIRDFFAVPSVFFFFLRERKKNANVGGNLSKGGHGVNKFEKHCTFHSRFRRGILIIYCLVIKKKDFFTCQKIRNFPPQSCFSFERDFQERRRGGGGRGNISRHQQLDSRIESRHVRISGYKDILFVQCIYIQLYNIYVQPITLRK